MQVLLGDTPLFCGMNEAEITKLKSCLGAYTKRYEKEQTIFRCGERIRAMGLVLCGSVLVRSSDPWGNSSILGQNGAGQVFGEAYACLMGEPLLVDVVACEKSEILFLDVNRIFTPCADACACHGRLAANLAHIFARKNLGLSQRILHTTPKTIRGRLISYFSEQAAKNGTSRFEIPFDRQQLADYLSVDRSALSNELSKMQREGLLTYRRNAFVLNRTQQGG